jgi:hypothetical protein
MYNRCSFARSMKRLLPLSLIMLWACLGPGESLAQREVQIRSGALALTLAIPKTVYHPGEEVRLCFTLRNISQTLAIVRSSSPRLFDFAVYNDQGVQLLAPALFGKPLLTRPGVFRLQPGETITAELVWDLTIPDSADGKKAAPPGAYGLEGYGIWKKGGAQLQTPRLPILIQKRAVYSQPLSPGEAETSLRPKTTEK